MKMVICGGSWRFSPDNARATFRGWVGPDDRLTSVGFRLAYYPRHMICGGSWVYNSDFAHATYRNRGNPDFRSTTVGFRLAVSP